MVQLQELINIANEEYDGHFTLMKFTTDWGCCFGTLDNTHMTSYRMSHGKSMDEAIENCIRNMTDNRCINRMENGEMIYIIDECNNTSNLFPGDTIKVICNNGKEIEGRYLGESYKYRESGHWYFTKEWHDPYDYCNYYYPNGKKKYLSIGASASARIDETSIKEIIVLEHKEVAFDQ